MQSEDPVVSVSTEEPDGTVLVAVALKVVDDNSTNGKEPTYAVSNAGVTLTVPAALVESAGGVMSLTFARLGEDSNALQALEQVESTSTSAKLGDRPVSIVLFTADGREWSGALPEALEIAIPVRNVTLKEDEVGECAYWDTRLNDWSTEGVSTISVSSTGAVTCSTWHLSLFGFVVRTIAMVFVCSAASLIFSLEGLQNLTRAGWIWTFPAALHWFCLLLAAILLVVSWRCDKKHQKYIAELKIAEEAQRTKLRRQGTSFSIKQVIAPELLALKLPERKRFTKHVYSMVVRQQTGETLANLEKMYRSVGMVAAHAKAHQSIQRFCRTPIHRKALLLYQANNAWVRFMEPSPMRSCVFRCLLHFAQIYSKWAVAAVFFNVTALAPDQGPDCEIFQNLPEMILRSVIVSSLSTMLGILPFIVLLLLNKCPHACRRVVLITGYGYVCLYSLLCVMIVSIFLSSVTLPDAWTVTDVFLFLSLLCSLLTRMMEDSNGRRSQLNGMHMTGFVRLLLLVVSCICLFPLPSLDFTDILLGGSFLPLLCYFFLPVANYLLCYLSFLFSNSQTHLRLACFPESQGKGYPAHLHLLTGTVELTLATLNRKTCTGSFA